MDWLTDHKIPVGRAAKAVFDWMNANLAGVFETIATVMETMIEAILWCLTAPHPLVIVAAFVALTRT